MGIQTALDAVVDAPRLIDAMRLADDLAFEAGRDPGVRTVRVLSAAIAGRDQLVAIAAVHALAEVFDEQASRVLSRLLSDDRSFIREHAAGALGRGLPRFDAIGRLLGQVAAGGFTGMLAQHTLERWSSTIGDTIAIALESALLGTWHPGPRSRLIETLGLMRQPIATRRLLEVALDDSEHETPRIAALAAVGQRPDTDGLVGRLEPLLHEAGVIADVARLAIVDLEAPPPRPPERVRGLTIAQLFLHADIDSKLLSAGAGDNGGIATLLVRLGDALVAGRGVQRVLTLSRGPVAQAPADLLAVGGTARGHLNAHVPLLSEPVPSAAAWPLRVAARRGIRRMLRAAGHVDLMHLRMADVGSLAAADVARELGIPVVFTVAPDPHTVIVSLDRSGALTREGFGETDLREHFWFRTRLVQSLAANAAHTVLFPRPDLSRDMRDLIGIDIASHPERHTVVAEGVDLQVIDRAVAEATDAATAPEFSGLRALLEQLPAERRRLPIIASVGRMHRVKGMATLVECWALSGLRDRANLLIIGGDLQRPSLDEREQLERIDAVVPADTRAATGLLLPGHLPNDEAARWLAAVRRGIPNLIAPGSVYVCASLKEEFGIALLEAMGTGLFVVAPDGGGPATYVEDGITGVLTATWDAAALTAAIDEALDLAAGNDAARARRAHDMVEQRFTIQAMAAELSTVYRAVAASEAELVRAAGLGV